MMAFVRLTIPTTTTTIPLANVVRLTIATLNTADCRQMPCCHCRRRRQLREQRRQSPPIYSRRLKPLLTREATLYLVP